MQDAARFILLYLVMPAWLLAGMADWACHRHTGLERTTGVKESLLHLLMIAQVGLGVLAVLFLEINSAVLLLLAGLLVAHALTSHWDLHYASGKRFVGAFEQTMHAYLESIAAGGFRLAGGQLLAAVHRDLRRGRIGARLALGLEIRAAAGIRHHGTAGRLGRVRLRALRRRVLPQPQGAKNCLTTSHALRPLRVSRALAFIAPGPRATPETKELIKRKNEALSFFQCRRLACKALSFAYLSTRF
ncbi:hypothetical protein [Polaromonas sp. YR568]|uniref:hypothetical protein n=1 Tax=Polaromonas sp. YR568 TaxID=1855301 RepID=UPI00398BD0A9